MKDEGIDFRLPLLEERSRRRSDQDHRVGGADLQHGDEDEDDSLDWLQALGLQDKLKTPGGLSLQLQNQSPAASLDQRAASLAQRAESLDQRAASLDQRAESLDQRAESLAVVEGAHTFTLLNFLLNWGGAVAGAGPQAGLPPTLLSPVAFRGGAMQLLKSRCGSVKSQLDRSFQDLSSLEVTGPVLPSALHAVTQLLRRSQDGEFCSVLSTHRPTAVLNAAGGRGGRGPAPAPPPPDLSSCGLHPDTVQLLLPPPTLGKAALTHIKLSRNRYSWRS